MDGSMLRGWWWSLLVKRRCRVRAYIMYSSVTYRIAVTAVIARSHRAKRGEGHQWVDDVAG